MDMQITMDTSTIWVVVHARSSNIAVVSIAKVGILE